jgi:1,4-alpha-glucan branching enzyme
MNSPVVTPTRTQAPDTTKTPQNSPTTSAQSGARQATKGAEGRKEVPFEIEAASAREVLLAGDFTGWEKTPIKLRKGERGTWRTTVLLPPGQYCYKFVVDGQWKDDPRATAHRPNPFGGSDSVRVIS